MYVENIRKIRNIFFTTGFTGFTDKTQKYSEFSLLIRYFPGFPDKYINIPWNLHSKYVENI